MVMLMETPASTFYLNLNAENNNTYIASNGIAEAATQVADGVLRLADGGAKYTWSASRSPAAPRSSAQHWSTRATRLCSQTR